MSFSTSYKLFFNQFDFNSKIDSQTLGSSVQSTGVRNTWKPACRVALQSYFGKISSIILWKCQNAVCRLIRRDSRLLEHLTSAALASKLPPRISPEKKVPEKNPSQEEIRVLTPPLSIQTTRSFTASTWTEEQQLVVGSYSSWPWPWPWPPRRSEVSSSAPGTASAAPTPPSGTPSTTSTASTMARPSRWPRGMTSGCSPRSARTSRGQVPRSTFAATASRSGSWPPRWPRLRPCWAAARRVWRTSGGTSVTSLARQVMASRLFRIYPRVW